MKRRRGYLTDTGPNPLAGMTPDQANKTAQLWKLESKKVRDERTIITQRSIIGLLVLGLVLLLADRFVLPLFFT